MDAKLKALKARNEYILSMDSANAAIHKYFVEDLSDIVDVSSDDKLSPLLFSASNNIWEMMREKGKVCMNQISELHKTFDDRTSLIGSKMFQK